MFDQNNIPQTAIELKDAINTLANEYGLGDVVNGNQVSESGIVNSSTTFGDSSYIQVYVAYNVGKKRFFFSSNIRVSDHSVGAVRYFEHSHVTSQELYDSILNALQNKFSEIVKKIG